MNLWEMSLTGGVWIAAAFFLRQTLGPRLPAWLMPTLWWVILLRLLVPVAIPSPMGIFRPLSGSPAPVSSVLSGAARAQLPVSLGDLGAQAGLSLVPILWGSGVVLCLGVVLWHWLKSRRIFRESIPAHEPAARHWLSAHPTWRSIQVRQSDRIASPLTYGVIRPVILLPARRDWSWEELECVLAHEYIHIRHLDSLTKAVVLLTACLHWFNPLVWCMVLLVSRDLELFCDWRATRLLGRGGRKRYALALLQLESVRSVFPTPFSYFTTHPLSERIEVLMKRNKISLFATALAMVLMFAAGAIFTTQAQANQVSQGNAQGQNTSTAQQADTVRQTTSQGQQLRDGSCLTDDTTCPQQADTVQQTTSQGQQLRDGSCLTDDSTCQRQADTTQRTPAVSSWGHHQESHQHHAGNGHH